MGDTKYFVAKIVECPTCVGSGRLYNLYSNERGYYSDECPDCHEAGTVIRLVDLKDALLELGILDRLAAVENK